MAYLKGVGYLDERLPISLTAVMFYVDYLISLTHLCFIVFSSMCIVLIDVLIFSCTAARVFNKLTYLPTYLHYS